MDIQISGGSSLRGELDVPGDKSISHRAIMLGALAEGTTEIYGLLEAKDCLATIDCFRQMGIEIHSPVYNGQPWKVIGRGLYGLKKPIKALYVGNSGTTIRLMAGILAGQKFDTQITGDESLCRRPMGRIIEPLGLMGGKISGVNGGYPPLNISGGQLHGIKYRLPVASAQVKSAILFAGLYARGETVIKEPAPARDHTEIMLKAFGAKISHEAQGVRLKPCSSLRARTIWVPGDFSSAAFYIVAAGLLSDSYITIRNVGINPTRIGLLHILKKMGADINIINKSVKNGEPRADIRVKSSKLQGVEVGGSIIPTLIDEIPVLAVAAALAQGTTVIKDAGELRVKESDRIASMVQGLSRMGARIQETRDGLIVEGRPWLEAAEVESFGDHRIAMALTIAALKCKGTTTIRDTECVNISYPDFFRDLKRLQNII